MKSKAPGGMDPGMGGGGGKSAAPGGMGGMSPGNLAALFQMVQQGGGGGGMGGGGKSAPPQGMAQAGGMGPMGGMPREKMPSMYGSVEAQNAASARDRMMRGMVGQGNDMRGGQMYGQHSFATPYGQGGEGGQQSPLDYAMLMQQQRAMMPRSGPGMGMGMGQPGQSSPGLLAQRQQAAAKVAQEQQVQKAAVQAKELKKKQEQQLRDMKNRNPLLYANATLGDLESYQGGSGGGA